MQWLQPHPRQVLPLTHTCICPNCQPELFPSGPPEVEGHIAHRFGRADFARSGTLWETRLNGIVCLLVTEARPGPRPPVSGLDGFVVLPKDVGFVVMGSWPPHVCSCSLTDAHGMYAGCQAMHLGDVSVSGLLAPGAGDPERDETRRDERTI